MAELKSAILAKLLRDLGVPILVLPAGYLQEEKKKKTKQEEFEDAFAERLSGGKPKETSIQVIPRPT